jgi:hypothetical protein
MVQLKTLHRAAVHALLAGEPLRSPTRHPLPLVPALLLPGSAGHSAALHARIRLGDPLGATTGSIPVVSQTGVWPHLLGG